ncbi:MAG: hypothetical protein JSR82_23795 [Verrucomicrobia bacterium]|nr:hypothetical protein [Verrucomicrobiota bacterium]
MPFARWVSLWICAFGLVAMLPAEEPRLPKAVMDALARGLKNGGERELANLPDTIMAPRIDERGISTMADAEKPWLHQPWDRDGNPAPLPNQFLPHRQLFWWARAGDFYLVHFQGSTGQGTVVLLHIYEALPTGSRLVWSARTIRFDNAYDFKRFVQGEAVRWQRTAADRPANAGDLLKGRD